MSRDCSTETVDVEFWSADRKLGMRLTGCSLGTILENCVRAGDHETGGILIGHYTDALDCAVVSHVTGRTRGSRAGRTWFERAVDGLNNLLRTAWRRGRGYYLGEWHFHPGGNPTPSNVDAQSMRSIAADAAVDCARPILLIIGGRPLQNQWTSSVHVFSASGPGTHLERL